MGRQTSTTDTFEEILEQGRTDLTTAREEYAALEGTETVPEQLVEAIGELERELDELDQTLEVTADDVELAEQTTRLVTLLADVFSALREGQRTIVEADVDRLDRHVSGIADLVRQHDLADVVEPNVDELEQQYSMLETLVDNERYEQIEISDRVSLEKLDADIRQVDVAIADDVPDEARADTYLEIADQLLDDIHASLSELGEDNEDRTSFSSDLKTIKADIEEAEEELQSGSEGDAAHTARVALEGCLMLQFLTARAHARQRVAEALATTIAESSLSVGCDVDQCVDQGDVDTLLAAITDVLNSEIASSTSSRLERLLREHDGSVDRTAQATDFEVSTILERLTELYDDGQISDITVEFS